MKALQITAPGRCSIVETEVPVPEEDELLIKIEAVATCPQWDLHLWNNEPMFLGHRFTYPYPIGQPGHEAAGRVEMVGKKVHDVEPGDVVAIWKDPGHHVPGCYAQYVAVKADHVCKIPAERPIEDFVSLELCMCMASVFIMIREMGGCANKRVGITGCGPAGIIAAQMAKAEGASQVIGFDLLKSRRDEALHMGPDCTYHPNEHPLEKRPHGSSLDIGIDCVGAKQSVEWLMDHTNQLVALFGVQKEDYAFTPLHYSGLCLCGYRGHHKRAAQYAYTLIEQKRIHPSCLYKEQLPLTSYQTGLEYLQKKQALKILYRPWIQ